MRTVKPVDRVADLMRCYVPHDGADRVDAASEAGLGQDVRGQLARALLPSRSRDRVKKHFDSFFRPDL
jgi:hypothetical protein